MEINDYSYRTTDTINGKMIGHFTQVVWKASQKVGVGIAVGQRGDTFTVYIVARYSPSGNFNNIRSGESRGAARIRNYGNNVLKPNSKYSIFIGNKYFFTIIIYQESNMQQIFGHSTTLLALPNILLGERQ